MVTSKDVFAKRREGALDDAYQMGLELLRKPVVDEWDKKAIAWCCIDLIKRDSSSAPPEKLDEYRQLIKSIDASGDEILGKQIVVALSLCTKSGQDLAEARRLSKAGKHQESAGIYRRLIADSSTPVETHTSFAWEIYKHSKFLLTQSVENAPRVKAGLQEYLQLSAEKPSLIHSCMLQLASGLAAEKKLDMAKFVGLWGLDNLRPEDFERFKGEDGNVYPSLAEKVLQQASKTGAKTTRFDWTYLLPHLEAAISRYPDNKWLKLHFAKALLITGRADDAFSFAIQVTKSMQTEYWAWELLGDISTAVSPDRALSCYAKALSRSPEEKFIVGLRLKFAGLLVQAGELAHAKHEVQRAVAFVEQESKTVPEAALSMLSARWYGETDAAASNTKFYIHHSKAAESVLLDGLSWIDGNAGEAYPDPKKEGKVRRRIFVHAKPCAFEVSVPGSKFDLRGVNEGDGLQIKGEFDADQRFHVYSIEKRDAPFPWDSLPVNVGIVDHVNQEKKVVHYVLNKGVDGLIGFSQLSGLVQEGDAVAVRRSQFASKEGRRHRVVWASKTDLTPSPSIRKTFQDVVRIDSGMGFVQDEIFVPPPLVTRSQMQEGDIVVGIAVLTFNKKRSTWGWKAVSVDVKR